MQVVIAGGHGKIALELTRLLDERGDLVRSLIRNPEHSDDVFEAGATEPIVCDLEEDDADRIAGAVGEADAVVFAAGAGPGSSADRKESMDYGGAVKLIAAAQENDIDRYVIVSSMGADADHEGDEVFDAYLRAKGRADRALAESGLRYTIVRPGGLTDDVPTGKVFASESGERGSIPRADVAAVLAASLCERATIGQTFEVISGKTPIEKALAALGGGKPSAAKAGSGLS
jgi:uncharacterized protein YbjT (DUF2867 family)